MANEDRSTYDELARIITSQRMSSNVQKWRTDTAYNATNTSVAPPTGGKINSNRNARDLITTINEYAAGTTLFASTTLAYNDRDELAQVTSPKSKITTFTNDWLGRRTATSDPDAGASSSTYDGNDNVATTTDARNITVTTDYDVLDRPTRRFTGTQASPNVLSSWAYDTATNGKGRPKSSTAKITPPGGSTALDYTSTVTGYDVDGQATGASWSIPAGFGIPTAQTYSETYGYDAAGHVTSAAYPAIGGLPAETLTASWTSLGLPSTLSSSVGGSLVASTSFDALGRLTGRRWNDTTCDPLCAGQTRRRSSRLPRRQQFRPRRIPETADARLPGTQLHARLTRHASRTGAAAR